MHFKLAVFSTAINVLALIMPLALLQVYDRILPNQSAGTAFVVFFAVGVALVLGGLLRVARARSFSRISALADHRNWMAVSERLMSQDADFQSAQHLLDIPPKARDAEAGEAAVALYDAPFAVVFLGLIWFLGGYVVLAPLAIICLAAAIVVFTRSQGEVARDLFATSSRNMKLIVAQLTFGAVGDLRSVAGRLAAFSSTLRHRAHSLMGVELAAGRQLDLMQVAGLATTVLVVGFGAAVVLNGDMTTGGLAACTLLGSRAASQGIGAVLAVSRRGETKAAQAELRNLESKIETGVAPEDCIQTLSRMFSLDETTAEDVILIEGEESEQEAAALQALVTSLWSSGGHRVDTVLIAARPMFVRGSLLENLSAFDAEREKYALELSVELGLDVMIGRLAQGYETEVSRTNSGGLSHGAVKRAMIVQALVMRPKLLLLERPAAGLDLDGRKRLAAVLQGHTHETAVVMTTSEEALSDIATKRVQALEIELQNGGAK